MTLDVAVVGCGHMGTHHARTIAAHPDCRLVAAVDLVPSKAASLAARYGGEVRQTVPEGVHAVVVATPTSTHLEVAAPLLEAGRWCLVEKPLAASLEEASLLEREQRLVVGHIERFNPAVRAAEPLQPTWIETRRMAPHSPRSNDVDVVLDLMIHDLDLVLRWGGEVEWLDAVGVAVMGDRIDTASVRLRTGRGVTATLVASRVAETARRTVRVYESGRFTTLDLLEGTARREGGGLHAVDGRDALTAQWDAFVETARGQREPEVGGDAATRAVALAARIQSLL